MFLLSIFGTIITRVDASSSPRVVARAWAIRSLREFLLTLTDEDHSMCRVASDRGIFCQGFRKLNDAELREHLAGIVKRRPGANRWQLEALGNQWELARQTVNRFLSPATFSRKSTRPAADGTISANEDLARYCAELLGLDVVVTPQGTLTPPASAG